jgi:hypothetical protein
LRRVARDHHQARRRQEPEHRPILAGICLRPRSSAGALRPTGGRRARCRSRARRSGA